MTGRGDILLAFASASALHAGVLLYGFPDGGTSGGDGGLQRLSLQAATPEIAAMLAEWDRPPETFETAALQAPKVTTDLPTPVLPETPPERAARPAEPPSQTHPEAAPVPVVPPTQPVASLAPASPVAPAPIAAPPSALPQPMPEATRTEAPPRLDPAPFTPDTAPRLTERPPERPKPSPAVAAPAQVAQGSGQSGKQGSTGQTPVSKASKAAQRAAASAWAAAIERSIARHHSYPRNTRDEGRVRVAMVILPNGSLSNVAIAKSSGSRQLDKAALTAVRRAAPFPPAPDLLDDPFFNVGQWIVFKRR